MKYLSALKASLSYLFVIAIAVVVAVIMDRASSIQFLAEQRVSLLEETFALQASLEQEINEKLLLTNGVRAAIAVSPELSQHDFARSVSQLTRDIEDVINVAAAPGLVFELVYPFEPNQAVIGLNLRDRPDLMGGVEASISTGETIIVGPVSLVQGGTGFITRSALFLEDAAPFQNSFWGIVSLVLDADGLFRTAGLNAETTPFPFLVQDATGQTLAGNADVLFQQPVSTFVEFPGGRWSLHTAPAGGWLLTHPDRWQLWAAVFTITAMILVTMFAFRWIYVKKDVAEAQLEEAVNSLSDGFALYDSNARLVMCNEKYKEFYASSSPAMVPGASFEDILRYGVEHGQYSEAVGREDEWIAERMHAHRNPGDTIEQQLSDGRWLRLEERRTKSGSVAGIRVDITELKEALDRSEAANAAKNDFLNTVSHELRTPLSVILGYNAFLKSIDKLPSFQELGGFASSNGAGIVSCNLEKLKRDVQKYASQIDVSGKHLTSLIESILDVAAIEEGTLRVSLEPIDLGEVLDEVASQLRVSAEIKGLDLIVDHKAHAVEADALRLRQVLLNIVGNAVKFTEHGEVRIASRQHGHVTIIEVSGTGCGISAENLELIFDRFKQLDSGSDRSHGGLGLGLAISRDLVELQGGSLTVTSVEGEGSRFRISLKASAPVEHETPTAQIA